ncbi:MAG: Uma2 family endonuclease [Deinococcales bacterium]
MYAIRPKITVEEYLEGEKIAQERHEYISGRIYAMAGATEEHNLIAGNVFASLRSEALKKACKVFMSDMKLRTHPEVFYYPDVMLICDQEDRGRYFKELPCVIVEVLSSSTATNDKREKLSAYQSLSSLQAYILIDSHKREILAYYRMGDMWQERLYFQGQGQLEIPCLEMSLDFESIYQATGL